MSSDHPPPKSDEPPRWLDDKKNVTKVYHALLAVCLSVLLADLTYHKHGHLPFENWFGFHAGFGFFAYVGLVLTAKQLRNWLKRDEDYYD